MLKSQCMKNVQKIWLMFLSSILLLGVLVTLMVSVDWSPNSCFVNGVEYKSGEVVAGYLENADCVCNRDGEVDCELSNKSKGFFSNTDFTTKNLSFSAEFLNSLSNTEVNISEEIIFRAVSQSNDGLEIIVEKLDLCTTTNVIPEQVGFFDVSENDLVLTTIRSGDPAKFTEPCIVQNTFLLETMTGELDNGFKVYFRNENEDVFLADMCVYEGRIHNDGDLYGSEDGTQLCQCISGESVCDTISE